MQGRPYYRNLDKAMQQSVTNSFSASATNGTDVALVPANLRRLALIFSCSTNDHIAVFPQVSNFAQSPGILLNGPATANPLVVLSLRHHGDMVRAPWFGRGIGATGTLSIIEVIGPDIEECNRCD